MLLWIQKPITEQFSLPCYSISKTTAMITISIIPNSGSILNVPLVCWSEDGLAILAHALPCHYGFEKQKNW